MSDENWFLDAISVRITPNNCVGRLEGTSTSSVNDLELFVSVQKGRSSIYFALVWELLES